MQTLVYIEPKRWRPFQPSRRDRTNQFDHRGPMQSYRVAVVARLHERDTGACLGIYLRNRVLDGRRIATVS